MGARIPRRRGKPFLSFLPTSPLDRKRQGAGRRRGTGICLILFPFSTLPVLQGQPQSPGLRLIQVIPHLLGMVETKLEPRPMGMTTGEERCGEGAGLV